VIWRPYVFLLVWALFGGFAIVQATEKYGVLGLVIAGLVSWVLSVPLGAGLAAIETEAEAKREQEN
jgi:hypothetical protein